MLGRLRTRISFANVASLLAIVLAVSSPAWGDPAANVAASVGKTAKKALSTAKKANKTAKSANKRSKQALAKAGPGPQRSQGSQGAQGAGGAPGAPGQPGADAGVTGRQTVAGEATTSSASETALDGPQVTVDVPAGGANVVLGANYDAKVTGGGFACGAVYEGDVRVQGFGCNNSSEYTREHGAQEIAADGGSHTYTLRYQNNGGSQAAFRNRTLMVTVLR